MQFNGVETDSDSYATFDDMTYRMSLPIARKLIYKVLNKNAAGIATEQNADCIYKLACNRTKDETHQAMEAAIHNFNSLNVWGMNERSFMKNLVNPETWGVER